MRSGPPSDPRHDGGSAAPPVRRLDRADDDPSIRRTWWLLAGSFLVLGLVAMARLSVEQRPLDWLLVLSVLIAAIAAVGHRNAVAGLEARGRGEAESFARILHGLSRSVSADSIVTAIVDDLLDATEADHVVLVRRRPDAAILEATLVTRRAGVPQTSTGLPMSLLELPPEDVPTGDHAEPVAVGPGVAPSQPTVTEGEDLPSRPPVRVRVRETTRAGGRRASDTAAARTLARRVAAETVALLRDLGIPLPALPGSGGQARPSEVLARGPEAVVADRLVRRVQSAFGLSHTLAAPLRSANAVIGAIVLSRRERGSWPESARRLVRGAATETAAALERAESHREAAAGATTDALTGLPNRRYFDEFSALLAKRRRSGDAVAVLMIDIDRFKVLNDTYGHPVGDHVLRSVAAAIANAVRDHDVPARIGGEEFAVLLRNPGPGVAAEVGERVRQAVRDLDLRDVGVPAVSVSVGVANADTAEEPIGALLERADHALLRAKRGGRDRVIAG